MRKKKCKQCNETYKPQRQMQSVCSPKCAVVYAIAKKQRKQKQEIKQRRENLKTLGDYAREAQAAVNRYIRARDHGKPCISCQKPPRKRNAGHYLSVGAHPELRYNLININLQCEHCNSYKSGNQIEYRINLVKKLGEERVKQLEGPQDPKKYTIGDLQRIKRIFNKRARWYERRNL